jgi:3-isopropylmalate/(R)-2-methylmalate dehydratase large subunit
MATWGTSPSTAIALNANVPAPHNSDDTKALAYMGLAQGQKLTSIPVELVFIGSCTNARLSDLRAAASVMRGRKIKRGVRVLVVPGSEQVRLEAEREGLDKVFLDAGAEWRRPGCSLCIAMNGDIAPSGGITVSTSNRNFEGRQGKGARTILASPVTAAATAIHGTLCDASALPAAEAT